MTPPFGDKPCMHEALFDDALLKDTGVTTLDFAKAMIDEGYHPMTMYFPLVVHGAMLIEPTEIGIQSARSTNSSRRCATSPRRPSAATTSPLHGRAAAGPAPPPRRDPAARKPRLRWRPPVATKEAAE